ncbi:BfmA/BtgA family mobilization protein [Robiginitalea sp. M366]|uniref:BfmA/BtgA family mobilization protein n=1 Tax=Robiginitalea aestuariiviva TaxID=3036903 RepID=UPI00240D0B5B|nr:BfmA/BtgA family mobilization protein [Robiginitalea aestuariiviva]MDG1573294.1 BfmA/BtgA family mobilization protein [Robiginitalea aestuariiviva]
MDKEFQKEGFVTFKIKESVAKKYRKFARQMGRSNSAVLDGMLDFFERYQLHPDDELSNHLIKTEKKVLQRINAVIAIIKDIEKKQTLPTVGMLKALFEVDLEAEKKSPKWVEKKYQGRTLQEELKGLKDKF